MFAIPIKKSSVGGRRCLSNSRNCTARSNVYHRRLRCETLEDRRLLSVFTVTGTGDEHLQPGSMLPVAGQPDTYEVSSLRAAVEAANQNPGDDTIDFDPVALANQTIMLLNGPLELTGAAVTTTITGLGANQLTVDGSNTYCVFYVDSGVTADISGLTISHGSAGENGGGIFNAGTLTLTDSVLYENSAPFGGGVYNAGTLTLTDSNLSENSSVWDGGGIFNAGTATITGSNLNGNSASYGGVIYNNGTLTIDDSLLSDNSASYNGGAILNSFNGSATITGSASQGTLRQPTAALFAATAR